MNRKKLRSMCLLAGIGAVAYSCSSAADEGKGWYAGGDLGATLPSTQYLNAQGDQIENSWSSGLYGSIVGGYRFASGLRPEIELAYRNAGINNITEIAPRYQTASTSNVSGYESGTSVLANIWYDYRAADGFFSVLHPYGGVGLGVANVNIQDEHFNNPGNAGFVQNGGIANGSSTVIAYQLGFGAGMDLLANLEASVDFRYLLSTNAKFDNPALGGKWTGQYRAPSFGVGLKYRFGGSQE